jgi:hypothetical protein
MRTYASPLVRAAVLSALGLSGVYSTSALASKDIPYSSAASATLSGGATTLTTAFSTGADGSATLTEALFPAQQAVVTATWSIQDRSAQPGQDTSYGAGLVVTFSAGTTATPGPAVSVTAIPSCTVTSSASTCSTGISFEAPATPGNYQVTVTPHSGGSTGLAADKVLRLNFSVAEPVVVLDTQLTVNKQCVLLNAGELDLGATLTELVSGDAVPGATIDFFVDPELDGGGNPTVPAVGNATTDAEGAATLAYNVNGLSVGDHNLYAEYGGSSAYNPSNDSNILGVSYLFVGFQAPINPEGNSVFGNGRVIPLKIRLVDANNQPVPDARPTVWLTQYSTSTGLGEVFEAATSVSASDTDNIMRYVPEDGHYIYNWDLSSLENGTYAVVVDTGDSDACSTGPHYAVITVAKKGKK